MLWTLRNTGWKNWWVDVSNTAMQWKHLWNQHDTVSDSYYRIESQLGVRCTVKDSNKCWFIVCIELYDPQIFFFRWKGCLIFHTIKSLQCFVSSAQNLKAPSHKTPSVLSSFSQEETGICRMERSTLYS